MKKFLCPNFYLNTSSPFGQLLARENIVDFHQALHFVLNLPYKRISDLDNLALVSIEKRGTCSSKHGFLAAVAIESGHTEIQLETGYFRFKYEKIPSLKNQFKSFPLDYIVEAHSYLRYKDQIIDVTSQFFDAQALLSPSDLIDSFYLLPHEAGAIKQWFHKKFYQSWCKQNNLDFAKAWDLRWQVISYFVEKDIKDRN